MDSCLAGTSAARAGGLIEMSGIFKPSKPVAYLVQMAWIIFLVALPVTSFPYFPPALGGGALVRPLALYPLLVLLVLFTLPRLVQRPLPLPARALLAFAIVSGLSAGLALLNPPDPLQGVAANERVLRAFLTLGLGGAIYLTVSLRPQSFKALNQTLRWIYAGMGIALLWGSLQGIYVLNFRPAYFNFIQRIQDHISLRKLFTNRVSGLTYEPNWFGEQISFLLLPWLLAAVLTNYTIFPWRWRRLTLEWFLLVWSIGILALTFSRAGLLSLIVLIAVSFFFIRPIRKAESGKRWAWMSGWSWRFLEVLLAMLVIVGFVFSVGRKNEFFSRLWNYWIDRRYPTLTGYMEYIGFGARFVYSEAAYQTYADHPVVGVGLGNYAYYFDENFPDRPISAKPEILRVLTPDDGRNRLITSKNFFLRLLAETGIIGTAVFTAYLVAILGCAVFLWSSPVREERYWGAGSLLGLTAFMTAAISYDSFALPNMWIVFGLTTAATWAALQHNGAEPSHSEAAFSSTQINIRS